MQILISARHMDLTEPLKKAVEDRISSVHTHGLVLTKAEVVLNIDHKDNIVRATVHGNSVNIEAHAEADDMYEAIHMVADKLEKQLEKRSGHLIKHK